MSQDVMREVIQQELAACERERGVEVLIAIESGSRSWGFASNNSDFDVRFVYTRPKDDYLRLEKVRDTIEWRLDKELDIVGWDLSKYLQLLRKSNPTTLEWLESDIVYQEKDSFRVVRELARTCVCPKSLANHYLGMATGNAKQFLDKDEPTLKKYLYVMRALLACKWVVEHRTNPPMSFDVLCEHELDEELLPRVQSMVAQKRFGAETDSYPHNPEIEAWVQSQLDALQLATRQLESSPKPSWHEIDEVFLSLIS